MKLFICSFLILTSLFFISCQSDSDITEPTNSIKKGNLKGTVQNQYDNSPIYNAKIKTNPFTTVLTTDSLGNFFFENINAGNYQVVVESNDYYEDSTSITVETNKTYEVLFKLRIKNATVTSPNLISPEDKEIDLNSIVYFSWSKCISDASNDITYEFYLDTTNTLEPKSIKIRTTYNQYSQSHLLPNKTYFWQIKVKDGYGNNSSSPIWSFRTKEKTQSVNYVTPPPLGKLPYPHHDPQFTKEEYDNMVNNLFIINNFGQDQVSYLHDGLDFVASNGTKIFAIDSGYVRGIIGSSEYYKSLIIEDKNNPGYAWVYTHISLFEVSLGELVKQGMLLAKIHFMGIEHIHLTRVKLKTGGNWTDNSDWFALQPDNYFYYIDSKQPSIQKPFYFFPNNSDEMFKDADTTEVYGKVDIVVGIREIGEYARGELPGSSFIMGDRLAVNKIEYSIEDSNGKIYNYDSFDFSKIYSEANNAESRDKLIYKNYTIIEKKERTGSEWSDYYSYYIITNYEYSNEIKNLNLNNKYLAWDTTLENDDGTKMFPNGIYKIIVTAYDFVGNYAIEHDIVTVKN